MFQRKFLLTFVLFVLGSILTFAQTDSVCSAIMDTAISNLNTNCDATGRNEACYGYPLLSVQPQPDVTPLDFDEIGDIEDIVKIQSLQLSGLDETADLYGMALLRLQANIPDTIPGTNVTIVLFGENSIESVEESPMEIPAIISANGSVNTRATPSVNGNLVTIVPSGTEVTANGRNEAGDWIRVTLPEGETAWIAAFLLRTDGEINDLDVVEDTEVLATFQAVYLQTGITGQSCAELPNDGLLIQTPEGAGTVNFFINEVRVELGSTAYITAIANDVMTIYLLDGQADISAFGETIAIPEGALATVPLDNNGIASAAPNLPEAYNDAALETLPLETLPEEIDIASPASDLRLTRANACVLTLSGTINVREGPGTVYSVATEFDETAQPIVQGQAIGMDGFIWWKVGIFAFSEFWIRSDLVTTNDRCDDVPVVADEDIPVAPISVPITDTSSSVTETGATSSGGGGGSARFSISECLVTSGAFQTGATVTLDFGQGGFATFEEATAVFAGQTGTISVDGQSLPVTYQGITAHPVGYGNVVSTTWIATAGTHTIYGAFTTGSNTTCVITVP